MWSLYTAGRHKLRYGVQPAFRPRKKMILFKMGYALKYSSGSVGLRKFRRKVLSINQILEARLSPRGFGPYKKKNGPSRLRGSFSSLAGKGPQKNSYKKVALSPSTSTAGKRKIKPIIPKKSTIIILKDKPDKTVYNRRILDYKHTGLLQRYIGLGGKILPKRQTKLTAKQQRYLAKTIKTARVMGLLPFVNTERGFFR
jgi:small subunit ribosomal protein S18